MSAPDPIAGIRAREEAQRLARFLDVLRTSPDVDRRAGVVAAAAKGRLDLTEIVPLALADPAPDVRAAGARAAGAGAVALAHDTLLRLAATDEDADVRMEAIVALERLGYDYPQLAADLPEHARRRLPELRRIVRRPFGITWRRTGGYVLGLVVTGAVARALRGATDGRSDTVFMVLGAIVLIAAIGYQVWDAVRGERRPTV